MAHWCHLCKRMVDNENHYCDMRLGDGQVIIGWIAAHKKDEQFLIDLGIKLGERKELSNKKIKTVIFDNCIMSKGVMEKLDKYWGRFVWGLREEDFVK